MRFGHFLSKVVETEAVLLQPLLLANFSQKNGPEFYEHAAKYYQAAIEIGEKNQLPVMIAFSCLASLFRDTGKYLEALRFIKKADENTQDYHGENHPRMADIYNEYGNIYLSQGEFIKALNYYTKSSRIYKNHQVQEQYAKALTNMGFTYYALGEIENAEKFLADSIAEYLKISKDKNPNYRLIYTYLDYSKIKFYKGELEDAIACRRQAFNLAAAKFGEHKISGKMAHFFIPAISWKSTVELAFNTETYKEIFEYTEKLYGEEHPETFENYFYYLMRKMEGRNYDDKIVTLRDFLVLIDRIRCFNIKQPDAIINGNVELIECFVLNKLDIVRNRFLEKFPEYLSKILVLYKKCKRTWRETEEKVSHDIVVDSQTFVEADFSSCEFFGYTFLNCTFSSISFVDSYLKGCKFEGCTFLNCNFTSTNFEMANLRTSKVHENCIITDAKFYNLKLNKDNLKSFINMSKRDADGNLKGIDLEAQDCSGVDFSSLWLNGANFKEANLDRCTFYNSNLDAANFTATKNLIPTALTGAYSPNQNTKGLFIVIPNIREGQKTITTYYKAM